MKKLLLASALAVVLFSFLHIPIQPSAHAIALSYQCDSGWNNYDDGRWTAAGVTYWGDVCMNYPSELTWAAYVETRSSPWTQLFSESVGYDQCNGGAWVEEFDDWDGPRYANYTEAPGNGGFQTCGGSHNYYVYDYHGFVKGGLTYTVLVPHTNP